MKYIQTNNVVESYLIEVLFFNPREFLIHKEYLKKWFVLETSWRDALTWLKKIPISICFNLPRAFVDRVREGFQSVCSHGLEVGSRLPPFAEPQDAAK